MFKSILVFILQWHLYYSDTSLCKHSAVVDSYCKGWLYISIFFLLNDRFQSWNQCSIQEFIHIIVSARCPRDIPQFRFYNNILLYRLKVWSTVKICGTLVPHNAIVPVGRPRPYSIIILNMRFIPKASLRASFQITASSYILERFKALSLGPYLVAGLQTNCRRCINVIQMYCVCWAGGLSLEHCTFIQCCFNVIKL